MTRQLAALAPAVTLTLIMAGCGEAAPVPSLPPAVVEDGTVEITADNLEFNTATIEAPAGEVFTIVFTNLEDVPHNVSVYTREGGEPIVLGEVIGSAGQTTEVQVPALEAGTYFFVCDIHANTMTGSLVVGGGP